MDLSDIARKLDLYDSKHVIQRAAELRRLCNIQFDSSIIGVVCKAVVCLEIAFHLSTLYRLRKAYTKEYHLEYVLWRFFVGIPGCFYNNAWTGIRGSRVIPILENYKTRFLASLPTSRRASAAFTRPVFIAVAFYLCAKKHKLKVDKLKLIELCGASETEFSSVSTSLKDLCFEVCGTEKEKKDPKDVKGNGGRYLYKRHKKIEKRAYEGWKTSVLISNKETKAKVLCKRTRQTSLNLLKDVHVHVSKT
ncbi:unnamed protein product [Malus baccata var. baccata]